MTVEVRMKRFLRLLAQGKRLTEKTVNQVSEKSEAAKEYWEQNKGDFQAQGKEVVDMGQQYVSTGYDAACQTATNIYQGLRYSDEDLRKLETRIENQGGHYRELNRRKETADSVILGGETLVNLLAAGAIPDEISNAYAAAYPELSQSVSFAEKVRELNGDSLAGFVSAVKGKLFEQKYVEYLNDGNLPEGYSATLAESANQQGWDIAIEGPNGEIASTLQAKATDSVSYVTDALERYPSIDVVTTEEVYSHLVMSGISENLTNGSITNVELIDALDNAVDASELAMDYTPPLFALAFIAFTSYKDDSLTLFEKARSAGDRTGKTYLSYLIGGGIAAITNAWWLGVIGSVGSRMLSEKGKTRYEIYEKLKDVEETNQVLIDRLKRQFAES